MEGILEGIEPGQLDDKVDEERWLWAFSCVLGPVAKANELLGKIDLGPALNAGRSGPHLKDFPRWRPPCFWEGPFIAASDTLAVSLLQARLIDLELPIKVEEWKGWMSAPVAGMSKQAFGRRQQDALRNRTYSNINRRGLHQSRRVSG